MTTAFVSAIPVLAASPVQARTSSFTARRSATASPVRRAAIMTMGEKEKIPQGFTGFSEELNGRAAMVGFALAVVTEAITGQGIIGKSITRYIWICV